MNTLDVLATIFPTVLVVDEEGVHPLTNQLPRPYLTRERTNEILEILGFTFRPGEDLPVDTPADRVKFGALMELIAGAIADWAEVKDDVRDSLTWEDINNELQDWVQEYLVG